jgi:cytochrome c
MRHAPVLSLAVPLALVLAFAAATPALASEKLAQDKQCMQCHAVDRDTIGPSFRTIKAVYANVTDPQAKLVAMIREGSSANLGPHWGRARMPDASERPAVSEREARQLARWILSLD